MPSLLLCIASTLFLAAPPVLSQSQDGVERALASAGENRAEIEAALQGAPDAQRGAMRFLIEHMPAADLRTLKASFLLENVALAAAARETSAWGAEISEETYRNYVLPYVNVSETREAWRKDFRERFAPLVKDCKTPGEAAQILNRKIFGMLGVRYSTKRRRADQSPSESIEIGMASCTGLSILLCNACRAACVPARLAGIPSWVNKRGNHTWVEIWDGTAWRYIGAAEPGAFDKTWFTKDAALAKAGSKMNAIYAVSYARTGTLFPMVWSRSADRVHAIDVTPRYTGAERANDKTRLMVRVRMKDGAPRIAARIEVRPKGASTAPMRGTSHAEDKDTNDFLTFDVARNASFEVHVVHDGYERVAQWQSGDKPQGLVDVLLAPAEVQLIEKAAAAYFAKTPEARGTPSFDEKLDAFLRKAPEATRAAVWRAYRASPQHDELRKNHAAKIAQSGKHTSPFTLKRVGEKPAGGWPLFIAMHGGGGAPQRVNDSQWKHMQIYYRDQKDLDGGYLYLALRAPNNTWNGFYDHYVWPLITRLIRQTTVCEDVNTDKVFLMGYSHGGYGAFAIGPNIPHRFAAVHASAAAPTPGISPAENLRNLDFTFMIGERDTRYERTKRCRGFDEAIRRIRGERKDVYRVTMQWMEGFGHGGLPDRDKIRTMYPFVRQSTPREVTWRTTGSTVREFYWLALEKPVKGQAIDATCRDNVVSLQAEKVDALTLCLDHRLVELGRELRVVVNGTARAPQRLAAKLATLCASMWKRGDPRLAHSCRVEVAIED